MYKPTFIINDQVFLDFAVREQISRQEISAAEARAESSVSRQFVHEAGTSHVHLHPEIRRQKLSL